MTRSQMPVRACFFILAGATMLISLGCDPQISDNPQIVGKITRFEPVIPPVTTTPKETYVKPQYTP